MQAFGGRIGPDFRPFRFLRCLMLGHRFTYSQSAPGFVTCTRCRLRRPEGEG